MRFFGLGSMLLVLDVALSARGERARRRARLTHSGAYLGVWYIWPAVCFCLRVLATCARLVTVVVGKGGGGGLLDQCVSPQPCQQPTQAPRLGRHVFGADDTLSQGSSAFVGGLRVNLMLRVVMDESVGWHVQYLPHTTMRGV